MVNIAHRRQKSAVTHRRRISVNLYKNSVRRVKGQRVTLTNKHKFCSCDNNDVSVSHLPCFPHLSRSSQPASCYFPTRTGPSVPHELFLNARCTPQAGGRIVPSYFCHLCRNILQSSETYLLCHPWYAQSSTDNSKLDRRTEPQ